MLAWKTPQPGENWPSLYLVNDTIGKACAANSAAFRFCWVRHWELNQRSILVGQGGELLLLGLLGAMRHGQCLKLRRLTGNTRTRLIFTIPIT